jgi:hypothetical protein
MKTLIPNPILAANPRSDNTFDGASMSENIIRRKSSQALTKLEFDWKFGWRLNLQRYTKQFQEVQTAQQSAEKGI